VELSIADIQKKGLLTVCVNGLAAGEAAEDRII
jgi:hypothetical protein